MFSFSRDVKLIGQSDADFLMKKYMVRNKEAMKNIAEKMEKEEINSLFKNTLGGSLKGGYAILWVSLSLKFISTNENFSYS